MIKTTIIFILLLLTLSYSCKKEESFTLIEGQVLEYNTNTPIEGATVILYGGEPDNNFANPGAYYTELDTIITEADGAYRFLLSAKDYPILDMSAEKDAYFPMQTLHGPGLLRGKDNERDIVLDPHAWLRLHIKNSSPFDQNDLISVWGTWGTAAGSLYISGEDIDEILVIKLKGNRISTVYWNVTKNGNQVSNNEDLYCPGHDTTFYEIFY